MGFMSSLRATNGSVAIQRDRTGLLRLRLAMTVNWFCIALFTLPVHAAESSLLTLAKQGNAVAAYHYGKSLLESGPDQAKKWLRYAAIAGEADAAKLLARQTTSPQEAARLRELALKLLKPKAKAGDAEAMVKLGQVYAKMRQPKPALYWLERAVTSNNPKAKLILGKLTIWGATPGYSEERALELLQQAADAGLVEAWRQLGMAHAGAYGGTVNLARSRDAFARAEATKRDN